MRARLPSSLTIALWISTATEKNRGIVRGVADFARTNPRVRVYRFAKTLPLSAAALTGLSVRGVIAAVQSVADARALHALRLPFVNITGEMHLPGITTIRTDDEAVGRLAARYFFHRGYRHLAYCGNPCYQGSRLRETGMRLMAERLGATFRNRDSSLPDTAGRDFWCERKRLAGWLARLPKPIGILVSSDDVCLHLVHLCEEAQVHIPDEVALLGASADETRLALSSLPVSNIEFNTREIGRQAGRLLLEIIEGRLNWSEESAVPPLRVVTRRSTDRFAVDDILVARAVGFIREHLTEPISVADVLRATACARRRLEMRFRATLKRSIYGEIQRQRFERAIELMAEPGRSLTEIAYDAGFRNARHLSVAFRTHLRTTPGTFREKLIAGHVGPGVLDAAFT